MKRWLISALRRAALVGWLLTPASFAAAADACPPPLPTAASAAALGSAAPARDRGMLWRITRDGRSSWLYGTLHVGKPEWRRFGPRLAAALQASDLLALEVDPGDPALAAEMPEAAAPEAARQPPPALQQRLARAYERACLPAGALGPLHPVLQAAMLTALEGRWLGMDPLHAAEQALLAQARRQGLPVVALETPAQQKAALLPPQPAEGWQLLDQALTQLEDRSGRRVLARLVQAWEQGDLERLENHGDWCECAGSRGERDFLRRLNDDRNPALADGIAARHARGARVFAAVGALHMTGPQSLPRLLAQRGFVVERIAFAN